jgi:DNA repair ATPase RecN
MYAAIRAYQGLENTYWTLTGLRGDDRLEARKQKKKQARAIASLQEQLADMSLQRDRALERGESSMQQVERLTQANRNADRLLEQLVQERNEAWNERDLLRQRVEELEEYNANLHEEFHALYNGMGPYAPPNAAQMDLDDDAAAEGSDGDASDIDDGPEE